MKYLKIVIVFLTLMMVYKVNAQSDIGLFRSVQTNGVSLEYRAALNDKFNLRIGGDLFHSGSSFIGPNYSYIKEIVDSTVHIRQRYNTRGNYGVRFGIERKVAKLGIVDFTLGGDVDMRYKRYYDITRSYYQAVKGVEISYLSNFGINSEAIRRLDYIAPSIRLTAGVDVPLGKRFILSGYYAANMNFNFLINEKIENDIFDEYTPTENTFILGTNSNLALGLRYQFGHGKAK